MSRSVEAIDTAMFECSESLGGRGCWCSLAELERLGVLSMKVQSIRVVEVEGGTEMNSKTA